MQYVTLEPQIPLALWVPLALAAAALLVAYGLAARDRLSRGRRAGVMALMTVALALPLVILLNPTWLERIPPPEGKPVLTILVDYSASMATRDVEGGKTRYELASQYAAEAARELEDRYEVRLRCFADDSSPTSAEDLAARLPDGATTDLAEAILDALDADRPQGQAVMILSDGIHNAPGGWAPLRESVAKAKAMATPLYVKTVGGQTEVRDLEIELDRPREEVAFVGQSVPVVVSLRTQGSLTGKTRLQLVLGDEVVEQRDVDLTSGGETQETFMLTQETSGLHRYEIRAEPLPGEVTPMNNTVGLLVRVIDEPVRVLLLEGKPYWDTKFLIRTLAADRSIELTAVVKLAEGRLLQRQITRVPATGGSTTTDVPAGGAAEEPSDASTLRDEQWAIRQDAAEILADAETLASYQVVILGRDAEVFLSDEALLRLEKWLKQRECFLVCFRGQPMSQIPQRLGRLMPVRWTPSRDPQHFRVKMTDSGRRLRWLPAAADDALAELPPLATTARIEGREVAGTLATVASGTQERNSPVISYLRVGMGRVVVVEGAGMWRWAFLPPKDQQHDETYGLLWRNLIRWLVTDVELRPSQRMALLPQEISFATTDQAAADLIIREEYLGEKVPEVELSGTSLTEPRRVTPVPAGSEPGRFRVVFGPLPEGQYRARVVNAAVQDDSAEAAFDVRPSDEALKVEAKPQEMKIEIAGPSGGEVLEDTDPRSLADRFEQHLVRTRPERMTRTTAWDRWWLLAAALALWGSTWGMRRWSGLV